ncbi:MAG: phosphate ABC transporter permease subunit PstC [Edaphobacter sp.]|uniref:phosphate ABC transporter permease subunit PstC n=1 Tax=Edaphobacter sp. TaxID=1934404 RepID=UPI0023888948|nr:phosphate ABC transporter permease subunit PstC [Edaphobacter sp.]MDE1176019.1 phosphate ABC transporter permease subunit PstC [Edaphobacter sp.]
MISDKDIKFGPPAVVVPEPQREGVAPAGAGEPRTPSPMRIYLEKRGNGKIADGAFFGLVVACALSIFAIVVAIVIVLFQRSALSRHTFGMSFFRSEDWDPVSGLFGAYPFIYGTLVSSFLALLIAVPLAIGVAIFVTELCPKFLRAPISFLTELLAAIPSVIYGLWGIFVLVPLVRDHVGPVLEKYLGWTGFFTGLNIGVGMLTASLILAIMILPIISSLTRDVMRAVPVSQREGVLALGATRWEMIRTGVLRNARIGIVGAVILGLGRALGETMAVTMLIGNHAEIHKSFFAPASTLASVIANEFSEATGDLYLSSLIEIGLALFVVTILVNAVARLLIWAVTRGAPARST